MNDHNSAPVSLSEVWDGLFCEIAAEQGREPEEVKEAILTNIEATR